MNIDHPAPSPERQLRSPPPSETSALSFPSTPILSSTAPLRSQAWATPAFLKRDRLSSTTFFCSDYDPFDEDEFRDNNRRKKTKFGRASDQWRFTEKSSSPESAPDTKPATAEPAADDEAPNAQVNGNRIITASEKSNKGDVLGDNPPLQESAVGPEARSDSVMVGDDHPTHQSQTALNEEQNPNVSHTGPQRVEPITVDGGIQTIRSGSEPLEQPHAVEEIAGSQVVEEYVPTLIALSREEKLVEIKNGDEEDTADLPVSRADRAKTPDVPEGEGRDPLELYDRGEHVNPIEREVTPSDLPNEEAPSPTVVSQSPGEAFERSQVLDRMESPSEPADSMEDRFDKPPYAHDMQEWLEARATLRGLRSRDPATVNSEETERAQRYLLEVEQSTGLVDQAKPTYNRNSTESLSHVGPSQDRIVFTTEESQAMEVSVTEQASNDYHEKVLEKTRTTASGPVLVLSDSPPSDGDEESSAPISQAKPLSQGEQKSQSFADQTGSEEDVQEQAVNPEFFSDGDERQWDPEEEDIIEEEQQRIAEGPEVRQDEWSLVDEEEEYAIEYTSEESTDDASEEEDIEARRTTQPPRNSVIEVIDLDDSSDEDDNGVAQSQTDGAALSTLPSIRRQNLLSDASLLAMDGYEPFRPSPPSLPNTVQDSQPTLNVLVPEASEEAFAGQIEEATSSLSRALQPAVDENLQEEKSADGVEIQVDIPNGYAQSQSMLPTGDLPIEGPIDPRLKNRVLTPNDTQPQDEHSQTSDVSLRSIHDTHDLPTPQLTQQRSSDIFLPASLRPSSPVVPSSSPPLSTERPSSPLRTDEASTLVDQLRKLKAEARASPKQSPKSRRVSNIPASISPWFAPKRSSEVVPASQSQSEDESGESNISLSEEEVDVDELEEDIEEIPSSMPEGPAKAHFPKSSIQPTSSPLSKSLPPSPTGLRTSHAYYAPLSTLSSHFSSQTSTLSIVLAATPIARANSGPRDCYTTIFLTDPSSLPTPLREKSTSPSSTAPQPFTTTTVFRPTRSSLPSPLSPGSVILLRSFSVTHSARTPSLLSSNDSAWAAFPPHNHDPVISGPPIEFGAEERGYVRGLWEWWDQLDASVKSSVTEQADEKVRKAVAKEEREKKKGRRLKGMGLRLAPDAEKGKGKGWEVRHELRDGKEWVDQRGKRR